MASGGVRFVPLGLVADLLHDAFLLRAGAVAAGGETQPPAAVGPGYQLFHIIRELRGRGGTLETQIFAVLLRGGKGAVHGAHIRDGPADLFGRNLQDEAVPRLQQDALRLHKPLPHGAVGGLAEVPALGVFEVGLARGEGDAHIGNRRAGEHAPVLLFGQVREDQALPVAVQRVLGHDAVKAQAAPGGQRLQQQMHLGIVSQGLKVPDALHGVFDRLPV